MEKNLFHLLPMNISNFDINQLLEEQRKKGHILWANSNAEGKYAQKFTKGDIVYIYCSNLPDGTTRILFRAIVDSYDDSKTYDFNDGIKRKGFFIKNVETICLNNVKTFSKYTLKDKYKIVMNRTKQKLATFEEYENYKSNRQKYNDEKNLKLKLIWDLEENYQEKGPKSLKDAQDYFNNQILCDCCNYLKIGLRAAKKRTFVKSNGLFYYETHHLLMQNLARKTDQKWFAENSWYKKEDSKWLDEDFNRINLCPVCHREFHYGTFEEGHLRENKKKEIIDYLWKEKKFAENLKKHQKTKDEIKAIKEYIYKQYIPKEKNS